MTIKPLGSQCYLVQDAPANHHVDLRAFNRNGDCTCDTFQQCCLFLLRNQQGGRTWHCPHILAVRDYVMDGEFWLLVEHTEKIIELPIVNETRMANRTPADVGI